MGLGVRVMGLGVRVMGLGVRVMGLGAEERSADQRGEAPGHVHDAGACEVDDARQDDLVL